MPSDETAPSDLRPAGTRVRFGVFELDRVTGQLFRKRQPVKLPPQPTAILIALVNKAGQEVTREELSAVWPAGTFVDFEAGIGSCVHKIRLALGDNAENPLFVKTLHGRGFCFIAAVQLVFPEQLPAAADRPFVVPARASPPVTQADLAIVPLEVAPPPEAVSLSSRQVRRRWMMPAAGMLVIACAVAWILLTPHTPPPPGIAVVPLTSFVGDEYQPSLSPDGSQAVFSWVGEQDNNIDLYIKQVDGAHSMRRLTSDPGRDELAAWSPDGQWIAFSRDLQRTMIVSPLGGTERQIGTSSGLLSWTPDSKEVVYSATKPGQNWPSVSAVSIATGQIREVLPAEERVVEGQPFGYSPDGRYFAFVRATNTQIFPREPSERPADVFVKTTATGEVRQLTAFRRSLRGWTWMPDSSEILFASKQSGQFELWRVGVTRSSSAPKPVAAACEAPSAAWYRPAPGQPASVLVACDQNSFVLNLRSLEPASHAAARRVLSSTRRDAYPRFSADGLKFVFVSNRSGADEIWMADSSGENPVQLTSYNRPGVQLESPELSPDGSRLLFIQAEADQRAIVAAPVGQGSARILRYDQTEGNPSWSRDGRSVYFTSLASGSWQIWKMASEPGAAAVRLTASGGVDALESVDGRKLYYLPGWGGDELKSMPTGSDDSRAEPVLQRKVEVGWWAPTAAGIYFVDVSRGIAHSSTASSKNIYFFDFATRRQTEAGGIQQHLYTIIPGFTASPDGRRLLYSQLEFENIDVVLLKNFR